MNSTEIRDYIGFGSPKTYDEVQRALNNVDCQRLSSVIDDLTPTGPRNKPLLADSRNVTQYGLILQDQAARDFLRKHQNLELAKQLINKASLADKVSRVRKQVEALTEEIQSNLREVDAPLLAQVDELLHTARILSGVAQALKSDSDE